MGVVEDDTYMIKGQPNSVPIPEGLLGKFIYDSLIVPDEKKECMVDPFTGKTLSYDKLLYDTCNLAEALRAYGCDSNTIISVCSENSLNFFIPVIAALYIGATVATINHLYIKDELKHAVSLFEPTVVFCSSATLGKFLEIKSQCHYVKKIIVIDEEEGDFKVEDNLASFIRRMIQQVYTEPKHFIPFVDADPCENVSFILCSSGTTGLPKGVMLTDRNILVRVAQSRDPEVHLKTNQNSSSIAIMPFFHGFGLNFTLNSIINKEHIICLKRFEPDIFLKSIQDYKVEMIAIAPMLAVFLAKSPLVEKYDLSSVEDVMCGAAAMSKDLENALIRRLKLKSIRQAYGLTETTLAVTVIKKNHIKPGSSGQVISYITLKVRDPKTGRSLGPNQVGEICVKGPLVMKGYFKNPQATKETFTSDGWLLTGDLAYYDKDGYFFIVDRLKELIKYKGYQVAPAELEAMLLNHSKVLDVGVVGVPDDVAGELPIAFVVKKPDVDVTEKELVDYVAKNVSPQKRLRGGVVFLDVIPKNASSKILRRELRKMIPHSKINRESKL